MANPDRTILSYSTVIDGHAVTFEFQKRTAPQWIQPKAGRGYYSTTEKDYRKKPRVYVSTSGETLLENMMNRSTRPVNVWGKFVRAAMKQVALPGKVGWSQNAGCGMCPCSPGFIWDGAPVVGDTYYYDVWVTIAGAPVKRDDAEAVELQQFRGAQVLADPTIAPFAGAKL